MRDLYKSPAIEFYGHCRLLLPRPRVPCFLFQSWVEKLLAWPAGDWTHDLRSWFSVMCLWPLSYSDPNVDIFILFILWWQHCFHNFFPKFSTHFSIKLWLFPEKNPWHFTFFCPFFDEDARHKVVRKNPFMNTENWNLFSPQIIGKVN